MRGIAAIAFLSLINYFLPEPDFSYKTYGNIANYFENKKDLLTFFEFKKGDVVAEVGALKGQNIAGLSILTDSTVFYAQDIDAKNLNEKDFQKLILKAEKLKISFFERQSHPELTEGQTNTFNLQIGTEKASLLPDNTFDKIILSSTFHEFFYMDEMISDLYKKLKPEGKLYILECWCPTKTHKNYSAEQTTEILKKHNFSLLKKDGKDLNGAKGLYRLVFAKN